MKAVVITAPGGPEVLQVQDVAVPEPPHGHIRVQVKYAGLNRADILQRLGAYPAPEGVPADIPGLEYSGVVDKVGPGASRYSVGTRVFGLVAGGAHAEYVVVHEREAVRIPDAISDEHAAIIPEAFITAYDAIWNRARLKPGEIVLVHAVGSGVGTALTQLARTLGCFVIGTSRNKEKLKRSTSLGMSAGIVPEGSRRFADAVKRAAGGWGVDVVFDLVGGNYMPDNMEACSPGGRIVVIGLLGTARAEVDLKVLLQKRLTVVGTTLRSRPLEEKIQAARDLEFHLVPLLSEGAIRAVPDKGYRLTDVARAHEYLASNQGFGKVLLKVV